MLNTNWLQPGVNISYSVCRKYYVDVKRREDAFDLSGPYLPHHDPVPLRNVSEF